MPNNTITIDLGWFLRYVTAYLDGGSNAFLPVVEGRKFVPVILNGQYRLFALDKLDRLLRVISSTFFKAYGGWRMALHFDDCGMFTGEASFTPADCSLSPTTWKEI